MTGARALATGHPRQQASWVCRCEANGETREMVAEADEVRQMRDDELAPRSTSVAEAAGP